MKLWQIICTLMATPVPPSRTPPHTHTRACDTWLRNNRHLLCLASISHTLAYSAPLPPVT